MANEKIQSLSSQVVVLIGNLNDALDKVAEVESVSAESASKVTENIAVIVKGVEDVSDTIDGATKGTSESIVNMQKGVQEGVDEVRENARQAQSEIESVIDEILSSSDTKLQELMELLSESTDGFVGELKIVLELIELGILRFDDLDSRFQTAILNGESLRVTFDKLDPLKWKRDIQDLARAMEKGKATIGDVLEFLTNRGGDLGKAMAEWVRQLKEGIIDTDRFRDEIEKLLALFREFGGQTAALEDIFDNMEEYIDSNSASG